MSGFWLGLAVAAGLVLAFVLFMNKARDRETEGGRFEPLHVTTDRYIGRLIAEMSAADGRVDVRHLRQNVAPMLEKMLIEFEAPYKMRGWTPEQRADALRTEAFKLSVHRTGDFQSDMGSSILADYYRERAEVLCPKDLRYAG